MGGFFCSVEAAYFTRFIEQDGVLHVVFFFHSLVMFESCPLFTGCAGVYGYPDGVFLFGDSVALCFEWSFGVRCFDEGAIGVEPFDDDDFPFVIVEGTGFAVEVGEGEIGSGFVDFCAR